MTIDSGDSKIGIVHAEPPLDWNIIDQHKEQELIWSRDKINKKKEDLVANIDMVYVGHTPVETPLNLGNTRYIDTGAFYTGNLTMEKLI
jgi:serine/threonine protein phosphatase 1